jgi:hypothetical protein
MLTFALAFGLLGSSAASASPITIISETGPNATNWLVGASLAGPVEDLASSWTATHSYSNVSVAVLLGNTGTFDVAAYLTTDIGPGTTRADQIAAVNLTDALGCCTAGSHWLTLFTGLQLEPNTYFLTLASPTRGSFGWTSGASPFMIDMAPGVIDNSTYVAFPGNQADLAYAPASNFENLRLNVQYRVTGTPAHSPVPEPASLLLLASGLLAGAYRWRDRRDSPANTHLITMQTIQTCPLCDGRGTSRRATGIYRPRRTKLRDRCLACRGTGGIALRRLQHIVRRGAMQLR